jgi:hypothetical protein
MILGIPEPAARSDIVAKVRHRTDLRRSTKASYRREGVPPQRPGVFTERIETGIAQRAHVQVRERIDRSGRGA